jgi:sorting nexin-5/6/32
MNNPIDEIFNYRCFHFREYLAMFKKTVSMHEVFLQRLAAHPVLRNDTNFRVFLEYKEDVN